MSTPAQPINTLHYGGSVQRKGVSGVGRQNLNQNPSRGNSFKKTKQIETIIRLENAGFTPTQISAMLIVSRQRVVYLMTTPDYLIARVKITHGIIVDTENSLSTIREQRKEMLTQLLPPALQALANEVNAKATTLDERKHQHKVITDLLDREGTFAKISRAEIKPVDHFDFEDMDKASNSIINTVRGIAAPSAPGTKTAATTAAMEANQLFSNSHTLSMTDQQQALQALEDAEASGEFEPEMIDVLPMHSKEVN
jgi:hypothetical protein